MATQSIMKDRQGPDWPLGMIVVTSPGTPVRVTSLVDPNNYNAPETATTTNADEYSPICQQIMFQGFKAGASHGVANNSGNVYIMRVGVQGAGNRDDYGALVAVLTPGQTIFLASAPRNRDTFSPYRYYVDADNASDAAIVTLIVQ
jgi:hypothetical protein